MASEVTDQDVQDIQSVTRPLLEGRNGDSDLLKKKNCEEVLAGNDTIDVTHDKETKHYKVVNSTNDDIDGATQALAVAPCDENGNNVDYSQTVITVGGTDLSNTKSRGNAFDVALGSNLTEQTEGVDAFYNQTNSIVSEHDNGKISVISGHSQGGPAAAKVGSDHKVDRIVNFQPYGSENALGNTENSITPKDVDYLNKHCNVYADQGKSVANFDLHGGRTAYGRIRTVEGSNHKVEYFTLKGNDLDIDDYVKNGKFCSGMTEEQAKKAARIKAKKDTDDFIKKHPEVDGERIRKDKEKAYYDSYYDSYVKNYEKDYGPYADKKDGKSKQTSSLLDNWELHALGTKVGGLATLLGAAGGGQQIFLKTEMLVALASQAMAQFAGFEAKFLAELEEAKEEVRRQCEEAKQRCLQAGPHLSSGEIEALMAPIQFEHVWDSGAEADIRAMLQSLKSQMTEISTHLVTSAERFSASDNTAAVQFM